jgi:hypothetical protein
MFPAIPIDLMKMKTIFPYENIVVCIPVAK